MLDHLLQITGLCLMIAVISVVYMRILAYEPIFFEWFKLGRTYGIKTVPIPRSDANPGGGFKAVYTWWYKPLFECEKCLAGQLGLWAYLFYMVHLNKGAVWFYLMGSFKHPVHLYYLSAPRYDLICHAYTICGSIFLAIMVSVFYNRLKKM